MASLVYDKRSGKLTEGAVWAIAFPDFLLLSEYKAVHKGYVYAEYVNGKEKLLRECPMNKNHCTGLASSEVNVDLYGGDHIGDCVPLAFHGHVIVSERFVRRLKESRLTGYAARDVVKIAVNQTRIADRQLPKLYLFEITGKGGVCKRLKVEGAPNLCPHCGKEPIVCPACGELNHPCPKCGQETLVSADQPVAAADKRIRVRDTYPPDGGVVEGKDWDGADWFAVEGSAGNWFVSRRAKEWLEKTHTWEVKLTPALLNVEGVQRKPGKE